MTDLSEGSARLVLLNGVTLLHPEDVVFDAMPEGWMRQQRGGRRLQAQTISDRLRVVRQFNDVAQAYPWSWSAAAMDEWTTYLIAEPPGSGGGFRVWWSLHGSFTVSEDGLDRLGELGAGAVPVDRCSSKRATDHPVHGLGHVARGPHAWHR